MRSLEGKRLIHGDKKGSMVMIHLSLLCLSTSYVTGIVHSTLKGLFQYNHICPRRYVLIPSTFSRSGHRFRAVRSLAPNHTAHLLVDFELVSKQSECIMSLGS